jgi:hypothetical protein
MHMATGKSKAAKPKDVELTDGGKVGISRPAIDDETMTRMEAAAASQARGQQRRVCLIALARGLDVHEKFSIEEPDAYGEMLDLAEAYLTHTKALVDVAEMAVYRLKLADSRH